MSYDAYSQVVQQGMQSLATLVMGDTATFNQVYANEAKREQNKQREIVAISKIAALNQDKILTDAQIEQNREKTAEEIKVMAAAYGTVGSGIDYIIEKNNRATGNAKLSNEKSTRAAVEQQKGEINAARLGYLSVRDPKASFGKEFLGGMMKVDWTEESETTGTNLFNNQYSGLKTKLKNMF